VGLGVSRVMPPWLHKNMVCASHTVANFGTRDWCRAGTIAVAEGGEPSFQKCGMATLLLADGNLCHTAYKGGVRNMHRPNSESNAAAFMLPLPRPWDSC
jgi:hypothetical protein